MGNDHSYSGTLATDPSQLQSSMNSSQSSHLHLNQFKFNHSNGRLNLNDSAVEDPYALSNLTNSLQLQTDFFERPPHHTDGFGNDHDQANILHTDNEEKKFMHTIHVLEQNPHTKQQQQQQFPENQVQYYQYSRQNDYRSISEYPSSVLLSDNHPNEQPSSLSFNTASTINLDMPAPPLCRDLTRALSKELLITEDRRTSNSQPISPNDDFLLQDILQDFTEQASLRVGDPISTTPLQKAPFNPNSSSKPHMNFIPTQINDYQTQQSPNQFDALNSRQLCILKELVQSDQFSQLKQSKNLHDSPQYPQQHEQAMQKQKTNNFQVPFVPQFNNNNQHKLSIIPQSTINEVSHELAPSNSLSSSISSFKITRNPKRTAIEPANTSIHTHQTIAQQPDSIAGTSMLNQSVTSTAANVTLPNEQSYHLHSRGRQLISIINSRNPSDYQNVCDSLERKFKRLSSRGGSIDRSSTCMLNSSASITQPANQTNSIGAVVQPGVTSQSFIQQQNESQINKVDSAPSNTQTTPYNLSIRLTLNHSTEQSFQIKQLPYPDDINQKRREAKQEEQRSAKQNAVPIHSTDSQSPKNIEQQNGMRSVTTAHHTPVQSYRKNRGLKLNESIDFNDEKRFNNHRQEHVQQQPPMDSPIRMSKILANARSVSASKQEEEPIQQDKVTIMNFSSIADSEQNCDYDVDDQTQYSHDICGQQNNNQMITDDLLFNELTLVQQKIDKLFNKVNNCGNIGSGNCSQLSGSIPSNTQQQHFHQSQHSKCEEEDLPCSPQVHSRIQQFKNHSNSTRKVSNPTIDSFTLNAQNNNPPQLPLPQCQKRPSIISLDQRQSIDLDSGRVGFNEAPFNASEIGFSKHRNNLEILKIEHMLEDNPNDVLPSMRQMKAESFATSVYIQQYPYEQEEEQTTFVPQRKISLVDILANKERKQHMVNHTIQQSQQASKLSSLVDSIDYKEHIFEYSQQSQPKNSSTYSLHLPRQSMPQLGNNFVEVVIAQENNPKETNNQVNKSTSKAHAAEPTKQREVQTARLPDKKKGHGGFTKEDLLLEQQQRVEQAKLKRQQTHEKITSLYKQHKNSILKQDSQVGSVLLSEKYQMKCFDSVQLYAQKENEVDISNTIHSKNRNAESQKNSRHTSMKTSLVQIESSRSSLSKPTPERGQSRQTSTENSSRIIMQQQLNEITSRLNQQSMTSRTLNQSQQPSMKYLKQQGLSQQQTNYLRQKQVKQ